MICYVDILSTISPLLEEIDEIPDAARLRWAFGAAGSAPAIMGMDVVSASEGRIVAMFRFLDGAGM